MLRRVVVSCVCVGLSGCGMGRMNVQPEKVPPPVEMSPIDSIHESINRGNDASPEAERLAGLHSSENALGEPVPAGVEPPRSRVYPAPWTKGGSSAPGAKVAASHPVPSHVPVPARVATPPPAEIPAPTTDVPPLGAPLVANLPDVPALPDSPMSPVPAMDPSLGPKPDAIPEIDLPIPATTRAEIPVEVPEIPSIPEPEAIPASIPVRAGDPSLGPKPDAIPEIDLPIPTTPVEAPKPATEVPPIELPEPPASIPLPSADPGADLPELPDTLPALPGKPAAEAPPMDLPELPSSGAIPTLPAEAPAMPPARLSNAPDPSIGPVPDAVPTIEPTLPELDLPPIPLTTAPPRAATEPTPTPLPEIELPPIPEATLPPQAAATSGVRTADPAIAQTSVESKSAEFRIAPGKAASETAARIGDDIITLSELRDAVREQIRTMNLSEDQKLSPQDRNSLASLTLDRMIDRTLLFQEARRKIKDKNWKMFMEHIQKEWQEKGLPDEIQTFNATDEHDLSVKLEQRGMNLRDRRDTFIQNKVAQQYLMTQILPKIKIFTTEKQEYYEAHRKEFDRPAQVRWREIAVEVGRHADRAEARRKAEAVLGRLRKGEPFEAVAKSDSEGPTAAQGGLWETTPDGYSVPAVTDALARQPLRQMTGILEGPESYHIVMIESRRLAGPARYDEVQDEIKTILEHEKQNVEMNRFLDGLRRDAVVMTMFDGTESAPGAARDQYEKNGGGRRR